MRFQMVSVAGPMIKDKSWVRQAFLVNKSKLEPLDQQNRIFSTASIKFVDTKPGGALCLNPPPQFTSLCDPAPANRSRKLNSAGLGRYYSEAIDDNSQIIHMRFGVPEYNSMWQFFTGFYSSDAGRLANTGRAPGFFYNMGAIAGYVVPLMSWKILAVHALGHAYKFLAGKQRSKYYYLKPDMPNYWGAVQTIVNQISVNKGIVPRVSSSATAGMGEQYHFEQAELDHIAAMCPDVFSQTNKGSIDVYAIATRAQRLARKLEKIWEANSQGNITTAAGMIKATYSDPSFGDTKVAADRGNYKSYMERWLASALSQTSPAKDNILQGFADSATAASSAPPGTAPINPTTSTAQQPVIPPYMSGQSTPAVNTGYGTNGGGAIPVTTKPSAQAGQPNSSAGTEGSDSSNVFTESIDMDPKSASWGAKALEFFEAELDDGGAFLSLRVNYTGAVSESFSSSVGESEISSKMNSISSQSRETSFNFAGGNIASGALGDLVNGALNAVKDFGAGILKGVQMSGLISLAGAAFVDIPQHWQSSSASLPRSNYTINLTNPYGNGISQLINQDMILASLLAAALPKSSGRQSYTAPFILELYDKGRCQTRLGMIDSLSITRGTGTTGFTADGVALGIEISFSIVDMSSIMHMPISAGFNIGAAIGGGIATLGNAAANAAYGEGNSVFGKAASGAINVVTGIASGGGPFDEDTVFTDYMAVLASMGLADQIYSMNKLKLNLTKSAKTFDSYFSLSHFASMSRDMWPGRMLSSVYRGTVR